MTDIFQGDPLHEITPDGAELNYSGGQPEMDKGFLNHANISLLTAPGWWGNDIEDLEARKINSTFLSAADQPITRQSLIDTSKAAVKDLTCDEFGTVTAETSNPESLQLKTEILIQPPSYEKSKLLLTRTGQNWISQSEKNI